MAYVQRGRRGLSLVRGMGAANCPSLLQLQGVTDPTDPCQQGGPQAIPFVPMGTTATCPSLEQLMGVRDPSDPCQSGASVTTAADGTITAPPPASLGFLAWLQANPLAMVGAALATVVVLGGAFGGGGGRRR